MSKLLLNDISVVAVGKLNCNVYKAKSNVLCKLLENHERIRVHQFFDEGLYEKLRQNDLIPEASIQNDSLESEYIKFSNVSTIFMPREATQEMLVDVALLALDVIDNIRSEGKGLVSFRYEDFSINENGKIQFIGINNIVDNAKYIFPLQDYFTNCLGAIYTVHRSPEVEKIIRTSGNSVGYIEYISINRTMPYYIFKLCEKFKILNKAGTILKNIFTSSSYAGIYNSGFYFDFIKITLNEAMRRLLCNTLDQGDWTAGLTKKIKSKLEAISEYKTEGKWTHYYQLLDLDNIFNSDNWEKYYKNERAVAIRRILTKENPGTVLDIAANQGYFSLLAEKLGANVTSIDYDSGAVNALYQRIKNTGYKINIRPAVVDILELNKNERWRYESDLVMALGLTHHLRLVELLSWDTIAELFFYLASKSLITEFKPETMGRTEHYDINKIVENDYNLNEMKKSFLTYFSSFEVVGEYKSNEKAGSRMLILCKK